MNLGVVRRLFRDALPLLVILTVGTLATECLFVFVIGEFGKQDQIVWMRVEFVQRMMKTLLGAELTPDTSATGMMSFGLTHPLIYAMCWAFVLTTGTRIPASEVERGTADLLLTLPISRTRL
ncbi:MAG: hypothetical protein H6834_18750, partial [Planctomycetes bacterium]|nr:hypothetical protein [Planctomycetota bacterium]